MTIGEKISTRRMEMGLSRKQLASVLGVPVNTVHNWETNAAAPNLGGVRLLSRYLEIPEVDLLPPALNGIRDRMLSGGDAEMLKWYRTLNPPEREKLLKHVKDRVAGRSGNPRVGFSVPVSLVRCGGRVESGLEVVETRAGYVSIWPPRHTSFLIQVGDDSMEDDIPRGSGVFVRLRAELRQGDLVLAVHRGEVLLREITPEGLLAYNRVHPLIPREDPHGIYYIGKVIGLCGKEDLCDGPDSLFA